MTSQAMDEESLRANAEDALKDARLPAVAGRNENRVRKDFWGKLKRFAGRIPFARELVASYFCATDPATPTQAKGLLFAALAYFILPFDFVPDFVLGLGFTDDATVLAMAITLIRSHLKPVHYEQADETLKTLRETHMPKA